MRLSLCVFASLFVFSCAHQTPTTMKDASLNGEQVLKSMAALNPELNNKIKNSVAYVVYPHVKEGAALVGGAYARGEVFEKGLLGFNLVGYSELKQVSAGLQLGAQTFTEVVFFENKDAFAQFKRADFEFNAGAAAVAVQKGKAVEAGQFKGYSVVIFGQEGLMGKLSIGGQRLSYIAL